MRNITIEAVHLPGVMNVEADRESCSECDSSDLLLDRLIFSTLSSVCPIAIDLFSSHWNAQLLSFVSWRPQPGASTVNAFLLNWPNHAGYAFLPFALIPKCLEKLRKAKVNLVPFCPILTTQPWFPILLDLACDLPVLLHPSHNIVRIGCQFPSFWQTSSFSLSSIYWPRYPRIRSFDLLPTLTRIRSLTLLPTQLSLRPWWPRLTLFWIRIKTQLNALFFSQNRAVHPARFWFTRPLL